MSEQGEHIKSYACVVAFPSCAVLAVCRGLIRLLVTAPDTPVPALAASPATSDRRRRSWLLLPVVAVDATAALLGVDV